MKRLLRYVINAGLMLIGTSTLADEPQDQIHFLIPAGPGGGWDSTARAVGLAMDQGGIAKQVTFENLSGGGGGRALAKFIGNPNRYRDALLISSTPIIVRSLQGVFPQTFRDLRPVASVISDYSCFAVHPDSGIRSFEDLVKRFKQAPRRTLAGGGSVRGDTDHFVLARALQLAGIDPMKVRYLAYDGGGQAAASLASKEIDVLSTGFSEAIGQHRAGLLRIIAVTAERPVASALSIPTLVDQGFDLTFANWRGFFAHQTTSDASYDRLVQTLKAAVDSSHFDAIRKKNGWQPHFIAGDEFTTFLTEQETQIKALMETVGYLEAESG